MIDNFPAAVAGADVHPRFTRGSSSTPGQRGFISDPARVRRPRREIERSVPYARERFQGCPVSPSRSAARR